jgi:magnesium transporter
MPLMPLPTSAAALVQVEHLLGRLAHLEQQVDATEDLVNIDLDSRRNMLVALDLLVTSITLMLTLVTAVAGVFGMNLKSGLEDADGAFTGVTVVSFLLGAVVCACFMAYVWLKGLLYVPDMGYVNRLSGGQVEGGLGGGKEY